MDVKKLALYGGLFATLVLVAGTFAVAGIGGESKNVSSVTQSGYLEAPTISTHDHRRHIRGDHR